MDDRQGQIIKGYELCEQIGVGGYGAVYRARQPLVGREVAVKIIHPSFVNHPEFIRRFEAEAHLVARLEHPHIVPLYDYWREPDGAYLVMRWLRAGSLHNALDAGPLPLGTIAQVVEQVAAALTVAHRRGIVHRDLKPANILLDEDGNAYLADFGIAKDLGETTSAYQTQARVIGSPEYLSPEQIENGAITPQTDIYSLGITLYEMVTGEVPFPDLPLLALLYKHVHEPVPSILARRTDVPPAFDHIIQRATAKPPAQRYPDVLSLARDVRMTVALTEASAERRGTATSIAVGPSPGNGRRRSSRYDTLRLDADALNAVDVAAPPMENPYKGLRAFQEADATDFFGREALTQRLLARLAEPLPQSRFLAVVGPSGSGKSSVVRAGLVPALRAGALPGSQRWFVVETFPGTHPIVELEAALLRVAVKPPADLRDQLAHDEHGLSRVVNQILPGGAETQLVLVIDQFEELFTRVDDESERVHLLASLLAATTDPHSRLRIIVTLRADFYDKPLLYTPFCELMRQRTEVVTPLSPDELRDAIVLPAERAGLRLDEGLVEAIVHDVGSQPGALPMLQYALTELFERRVGRTMTLTPYHQAGGVVGALARRAEEIYAGLDAPQKAAAQQLFLRLVTLGEGTEDTRRRVRQTELAAVAGDARTLDSVIDQYCQFRLLTTDRDPITRAPTVEVAHEALIRTWERLRDWLDASRDDLRLQRRLGAAATEWAAAGRDPSFLAAGARLDQFADWSRETHLALNEEEQAYLTASLAEREVRQAREAERQAREVALEARTKRVLRSLVAVSLVAAIIGVGLASFAFAQREDARRSLGIAQAETLRADENARTAAENAQQAEQAAAEAIRQEALARHQGLASAAQAELYTGNADVALKLAVLTNSTDKPGNVANPLPMAQMILSEAAYAPGTVRVFKGHQEAVNRVAFSPDGTRVISGGKDNAIILWDVATGQEIRRFEGQHEKPIKAIAYLPNGKHIIAGSEDATLSLWDIESGTLVRKFVGHSDEIKGGALSADGQRMLSASGDQTLILWDVNTGQPIHTLKGHTQAVHAAAFSPDGQQAISASQDTTLILWDVATGKEIRRFVGHPGEARAVAFSSDGLHVLSGGNGGVVMYWDVATGQQVGTNFIGHTKDVYAVALSSDGRQALTGADDEQIILWDVATGRSIKVFRGHGGYIRDLQFTKDGHQFISGSVDWTMRLWSLHNGAELFVQEGVVGISASAYDAENNHIITGAQDGTLQLYDTSSGKLLARFAGHEGIVRSVVFSPDRQRALSAADKGDGSIVLWDMTTTPPSVSRVFQGPPEGINVLVYLPDGQHFLSAGGDKRISLWDVNAAEPIRTYEGFKASVTQLVLLPDNKQVLFVVRDTVSRLELESGEVVPAFDTVHVGGINALAVSQDGKLALTGAKDKIIILWDVATGKEVWRSEAQAGEVKAIAFDGEGQRALIAVENRLMLWDLTDNVRQPIRVYEGHTKEIRHVKFSGDGGTAISTSLDRTIRVWRIDDLPALLQHAQSDRFVPTLTEEQEKTYNIDDVAAAQP